MKLFYPDFFNDVFGPIMQPGSSSSFAGTSRVGRVAAHTIKSPLKRAKIAFNPDDARDLQQLGNMMEDSGFLGGLQDFMPDDERLFSAHKLAREKNISYEFTVLKNNNGYPASVQIEVTGTNGESGSITGESIGGGMISIYEINGFPVSWQGDTYALLVINPEKYKFPDKNNTIVENKMIKNKNGDSAVFIEFSEPPDTSSFESSDFCVFPALLPVVSCNGRKEQLFKTASEWISYSEKEGISIVDAAIQYEKNFSLWSEKQIWDYFEHIRSVLNNQIHSLENLGYENVADTELLPIYGKFWNKYRSKSLQDPITRRIMDYAFSVNAKIPGVKIVPGPMGTGGGYLFSALEAVREARNISPKKQLEALAVAASLGAIAFTLSKASGLSGCVGESGVCCAMASGAITWMSGGSARQVEAAASMALQANIGIPCDPIPGGLEFPCLTRTVRAAVTAPLYADMALCGIDPLIPYHEMLFAIEKNRQKYSDALCGADCGVNCTPTAEKCRQFLSTEVMDGKLKYEA
ncbi:MAG: L-serine ammonia-lyase, iron-sulfur-dependent, subunit alpha [Spirochaetaceae bacterium]|jgi:L-serine dehydratase|nr:L-serine ammonia-lyase, iron-sulfur-dependent, subunit alpha [Spirochaetaceae bacterium]